MMDSVSDNMTIAHNLVGGPPKPKRMTSLTFHEPQRLNESANDNNESLDFPGQEWHRHAIQSSNTWTSSSGEHDDIEDRTDFLLEYNRLAVKHGIRGLVPDDYEFDLPDINSISGKTDNWFKRNILKRTSSTHSIKHEGRLKHRRSISDLSIRLKSKKNTFKDKDLQELIRLCGLSLLYLPAEYAVHSLPVPTCFRATAQFLVQHAVTTRGIFRIPGSHSVVAALYNHYCTLDEEGEMVAGTVRCPTLPAHIKCDVYDVASAFKRFLSGLPGGILGSLPLFYVMVSIQSQLDGTPELMRTRQSKVRARLLCLAILTVRSQYRRDLICAVFGLLSMIGRAAETARREDDQGRPLPTSDLMGYAPLGIVFGPLLVGEMLDKYTIRLANPHGGLILLPISPPKPRKDRHKKSRTSEEGTTFHQHIDKVKVANSVAEMLITHWRDIIRMMKDLRGTIAHVEEKVTAVNSWKKPLLRPSASESFILRRPPAWDEERIEQSDVPVSPSPAAQHSESLTVRKQRLRPQPSFKLPQSRQLDLLTPTTEESASPNKWSASEKPRKLFTAKSTSHLNPTQDHFATRSSRRTNSQGRSSKQANTVQSTSVNEFATAEHTPGNPESASHEHNLRVIYKGSQSQLLDHEHHVQVIQNSDPDYNVQIFHDPCQPQPRAQDDNFETLRASTKPEYSINDDGVGIVQEPRQLKSLSREDKEPAAKAQTQLSEAILPMSTSPIHDATKPNGADAGHCDISESHTEGIRSTGPVDDDALETTFKASNDDQSTSVRSRCKDSNFTELPLNHVLEDNGQSFQRPVSLQNSSPIHRVVKAQYTFQDNSTNNESSNFGCPVNGSPDTFSPKEIIKLPLQNGSDSITKSEGATPSNTLSMDKSSLKSKSVQKESKDEPLPSSNHHGDQIRKSQMSLKFVRDYLRMPGSRKSDDSIAKDLPKPKTSKRKVFMDKMSSSLTEDQTSNKHQSGQSTPSGLGHNSSPGNRRIGVSGETALTTPTQKSYTPRADNRGFSKGTVRALAEKINTADLVSPFIPSPTKSPKRVTPHAEKNSSPYSSSTYSPERTFWMNEATPPHFTDRPSSWYATRIASLKDQTLFTCPPASPSNMSASKKTTLPYGPERTVPSSPQKKSVWKISHNSQSPQYCHDKKPSGMPVQIKSYGTTSQSTGRVQIPTDVRAPLNPSSSDCPSPKSTPNEADNENGLISQYTINPSPRINSSSSKWSPRIPRPQPSQPNLLHRFNTTTTSSPAGSPLGKKAVSSNVTPLRSVKSFRDIPIYNEWKGVQGALTKATAATSMFPSPPRRSSLRPNVTPYSVDEKSCKNEDSESPTQPSIQTLQYAAMEVPMSLRCVDSNYEITRSQSTCPSLLQRNSQELVDLSTNPPFNDDENRVYQPAQSTTGFSYIVPEYEQNVAQALVPPPLMDPAPRQNFVLAPASSEIGNECTAKCSEEPWQHERSEILHAQPSEKYPIELPPLSRSHAIAFGNIPTRSNSILHSQLQVLQSQLDAKSVEIRHLKQQIETTSCGLGISSLCEQLRLAKKDMREWKARALVAEKQIEALTAPKSIPFATINTRGSKGNTGDRGGVGDGERNSPQVRRSYSEDTAIVQQRIKKAIKALNKGIEKAMGVGLDGASSTGQRYCSEDSTDTVIRSFVYDSVISHCEGGEGVGDAAD